MRGQRIRRIVTTICASTLLTSLAPAVWAAPTGLTSPTPGVNFSGVGTSNVTITSTAHRSIVNAQGFDIMHGERANIIQPNTSAMLIRVGGPQTFIDGTLNAMGLLFLLNPNGILFGQHAQVNVGGIVASSLRMSDANFLAGNYLFQGTGAEGLVKNAGVIHTSGAGAYLFAPNVENSGVINSPGGNIVLGAGKTAYLSNRPDGNGFLAEITAPVGQAVNVKDLIADGGYVTMAGRVVNQSGLIQANSVRERNGTIELLASNAVTLADGSRTIARGGSDGISAGGNIRAIADLKTGTATFAKGAVIDVSGGQNGGNGGFAEVSGYQVTLNGQFLGDVRAGYTGGRILIDPVDVNLSSLSGSGLSTITFTSPDDLRVTGSFDLGTLTSTGPGRVEFIAGQNLLFNSARLTNSGTTRWDYSGTATNGDIRLSNSYLSTGANAVGNIDLSAPNGSISLINSIGQLSTLRINQAGGNLTLTAVQDVISTTAKVTDNALTTDKKLLGGIRVDGPGNLTIMAGRDFVGGMVGGVLTGPGFLVANGTANVTAGRDIGGPTKGMNVGDPDGYANLTLGKGTINLTAQTGNIYLGRIQDLGLSDSASSPRLTVDPSNQVTLKAHQDIFLNPRGTGESGSDTARTLYPASFKAETETGNIFIEGNIDFWPSTTGRLTLSAAKDIIGVQTEAQVPDPRFDYIFVGFHNVPGGKWTLVCLSNCDHGVPAGIPDATKDPQFAPFLTTRFLNDFDLIGKPQGGIPTMTVKTTAPTVTLREFDLSPFLNKLFPANQFKSAFSTNSRATNIQAHSLQDVLIEAKAGNISTVNFNLASIPYHKQVTIRAGVDIEAVSATIGVPEGAVATVEAGRNLNMRAAATDTGASSDLTFAGTGTAKVKVGGLLDLADSTGINFRLLPEPTADFDKGGFLDVAVGGSVKMDRSRIATYNGASLSIHGTGVQSLVDGGGIPLVTDGKSTAVIGTVVRNGNGQSVIQVIGADGKPQIVQFKGDPVVLDGAPTVSGPVTFHLSLAEQGDKLISKNGQPVQVLRTEAPIDPSSGLAGFDPVIVNGNFVLVAADRTVSLVPVNQVVQVNAVPGTVTVGSNATTPVTRGAPLGIVTAGGGGIDTFARGNIDVETSRISTFHGGDINLTSTHGRINAGSGSRNESVGLTFEQQLPDGTTLTTTVIVPSSGISTFHPNDPFPLKFIEFHDPQIEALLKKAEIEKFFGRDVSALLAEANRLKAQREPIFNETVLKPYINNLKLGDVYLTSERGSIDIPSAGIQGRRVELHSPAVNFQGGSITGNVIIPATVNISGPPSISGTGSGAVSAAVTPVSGSSATASTASATAAVSTAAKSSDSAESSANEAVAKQSEPKQVAAKSDDKDKKKSTVAQSIKMKHGVIIQVEVKPQSGS